ncbi:latent-transforming growth factor beta-binding protein 4-like [Anas platyrhynchos]|uniref:latent-transforming growth factor beta-binding protein 4-like n=1 Tax=Anas platyrhynchos TaxID=8839 RepID=UPI003AF24B22
MEPPGAAAGLAPKRRGPGPAPPRMAEPRPLFDDTSGGAAPPPHGPARAYGAPPAAPPASSASRLPPPAAAFLAEPVSSLAAAYGSSLASQGRDIVDRNCSSPLPGLRTQDVCCRGAGVAWGVHECQPCDADPPNPPAVGQHPCPKGFRRANGSCVDVDECQEGGFCKNGLCTNTRGSFACLCHEGFILDSSRSSCISHQVISEAREPCYRVLREGRCALPTLRNITRQICCCSRVGKAWGPACQRCPPFGSEGFKEICPAGPGYHYSASDLHYNTRYLGQDLPRVPLGRPRVPSPAGTAAPRWRPGRPPPSRSPPVPEVPPRVPKVPQRVPEVPPRVPHVPPRVPEVPPRVPDVSPRVPEVPQRIPEVPQRVPEAPQRVPEVPPDVPEVPQRVPEVPPRIPEVPPPAPEVVIVPRPTLGLLGPLPTPPGPEGPAPAAGSVCERNPRICGPGRCVPRQGGYTCLCHPGFWLSTQGTHCIDVDECRRSPRPCAPGRCENTVGSFRCVCGPGYRPGPGGTDCQDVDECAQSPSPCAQSRCENLPGGYRCVCPAGYQASTPTGQCQDIDECENHLACPGQECANTPGSFQCRPCRDGFELRHGRCADVDECATGSPCGPHGRCSNTEGSFHCQCRRGYRVGAGGAPCADVNECLEGDFCFPHSECLNTEGSYSCLCAQGYASTPEGTACVDVDECQRGDVCRGGRCANTDGAFECHCPAGFRTDAERAQCHGEGLGGWGGGILGAPHPGAGGEGGPVPADVDECQEHGAELCGAERCENLPGSYRCMPACQHGYRPRDGGGCEDEDECAEGGSRCGPHAACHNLPGSFQCACHQGYEAAWHGHHCQVTLSPPPSCFPPRCGRVRDAAGGVRGGALRERGRLLPLPLPRRGARVRSGDGDVRGTPPSDPTPPAPPGAVEAPPGLAACFSPACGVLAPNVSRQQCCCSVGGAWGVRCPPPRPCPTPGTAEHRALCPHGTGQTTGPQGSAADVDECRVFAPQLCRGGVCINAAPGFSCYCPSGYYYEQEHLQCVDNDECQDEDAEPCIGGRCVNTVGSYFCSCAPPLVLDGSQRRCVTNDTRAMEEDPAVCWQEVGPDLVCGRPRLDRQATYTECCCLYGEAWGMDCALCPARHSDDFEFLCNVLRPPGPGLGPPYEYGPEYPPHYGLPYGPLPFGGPGPRLPPPGLRADYDPYGLGGGYDPRGDALYAAPPRYEDLEDFEGSRRGPPRSSRPRSPPSAPQDPPPWLFQPHGVAERPGRASEDDPRDEALPPELCGVLSGCEHGHCVRVPQGFTCACDPGYRLDAARVACVDLDECSEAALCRGGRCLNTPGSFRCLCPPGSVPAQGPPRCVPARPPA